MHQRTITRVRNGFPSSSHGRQPSLHERADARRRAFVHSPVFRRWYHLGLLLKGIDGALEGVAGALLLVISPQHLSTFIHFVTARELSHHPDDWIGHGILRLSHALSVDTQHFVGLYLAGHGVVKLVLVLALWRERAWAFPFAMWFLGFFLLYQLHRIAHTHSITLMIFTAFDVFVLWVVWQDWQLHRERTAAARSNAASG
jgi:uncharacterized membrane protein